MRISTLNTWGTFGPFQERWKYLVRDLEMLQPDLLFLQEVADDRLLSQIRKSTPLAYHAISWKAGVAILSRFPFLSEHSQLYSAASPLEDYQRGFVAMTVHSGLQTMAAVCTHLSWKAEDGATRCAQVDELLQVVSELKCPAIMAGDFNDVPGSAPIQKILDANYVDLFHAVHPDNLGITWDNQNPFIQGHSIQFPDRRIDFLFLANELISRSASIRCDVAYDKPDRNMVYPSDHYGLIAEING